MNGKLQGIIICVIVIICLGGMLLFLTLTDKDNGDDSSAAESTAAESEADESVLLIDSSSEKISSVKISNEFGEFTIEKPASGKTSWNISELNGLNQSVSDQQSLVEDIAQLTAEKLVEEKVKNLEKYGLAEPISTFTVAFSDDSERVFHIGDITPEKSKYRYMTEKDSGKVYIVKINTISEVLEGKEQFIDTLLIETPEEVNFGMLTIQRPDIDYDMVFEQDTDEETDMMSAQIMTSPIYSYLNGSSSQNTTHGLWGLTADSPVCLFPDDSDKAEYGIDNPTATVIYEGEDENYTLYIGNPEYSKNIEGEDNSSVAYYYCYLEGVSGADCIWKISVEDLPWATVMPEEIITTVMTYNNIVNIESFVVKQEQKVTTYTVEVDEEDEEVTAAAIDGKETDVDSFKSFYQYFLSCPTTEIWYKEPEGESFMTIEIDVGDNTDTLEFFADSESARKAIVKRNGQTSFRIPIDWTDKFINNMAALENGEEVLASY